MNTAIPAIVGCNITEFHDLILTSLYYDLESGDQDDFLPVHTRRGILY